jgi:hypothetical protein
MLDRAAGGYDEPEPELDDASAYWFDADEHEPKPPDAIVLDCWYVGIEATTEPREGKLICRACMPVGESELEQARRTR